MFNLNYLPHTPTDTKRAEFYNGLCGRKISIDAYRTSYLTTWTFYPNTNEFVDETEHLTVWCEGNRIMAAIKPFSIFARGNPCIECVSNLYEALFEDATRINLRASLRDLFKEL